MTRKWVKRILSLILTLLLTFLPNYILALEIQLKKGKAYKIRTLIDGQMERVGLLKGGSIIEIPDKFIPEDERGKKNINFEKVLNNWIRESEKVNVESRDARHSTYDNVKSDYFFRVKIKKAAPGSTGQLKDNGDKHIYIALNHMARRKNGIVLKGDAPFYEKKLEDPEENELKKENEESQTEADTCLGGCGDSTPKELKDLISDLPWTLGKVKAKVAVNRRNLEIHKRNYKRNFKKTCGGIDYLDFEKEMEAELTKKIPEDGLDIFEIMKEMSAHESMGGNCKILASEHDRSQSVGLFQINTLYASAKRCSSKQRALVSKAGSIDNLKSDTRLQCLENPIVNMKESVRTFGDVHGDLFRDGLFDRDKMSKKDFQRVMLAGYNGGQTHVKRALYDLNEFNKKHGASLDPNNWEDLRLFFFRRALTYKEQRQHFGTYKRNNRRSLNWSISNVAYAETMVPRETESL